MQSCFFLAIAAAAGVLMAVQGSMNGAMSKIIGVLEGNFILHAVGLLFIVLLLFVFGLGRGDLHELGKVPWYLYLPGIINVAIIYGVMLSIAKTSAGIATTAIIVGQLTMSLIVDQLGLFGLEKVPFNWGKGAGLVLMGVAAKLLLG